MNKQDNQTKEASVLGAVHSSTRFWIEKQDSRGLWIIEDVYETYEVAREAELDWRSYSIGQHSGWQDSRIVREIRERVVIL